MRLPDARARLAAALLFAAIALSGCLVQTPSGQGEDGSEGLWRVGASATYERHDSHYVVEILAPTGAGGPDSARYVPVEVRDVDEDLLMARFFVQPDPLRIGWATIHTDVYEVTVSFNGTDTGLAQALLPFTIHSAFILDGMARFEFSPLGWMMLEPAASEGTEGPVEVAGSSYEILSNDPVTDSNDRAVAVAVQGYAALPWQTQVRKAELRAGEPFPVVADVLGGQLVRTAFEAGSGEMIDVSLSPNAVATQRCGDMLEPHWFPWYDGLPMTRAEALEAMDEDGAVRRFLSGGDQVLIDRLEYRTIQDAGAGPATRAKWSLDLLTTEGQEPVEKGSVDVTKDLLTGQVTATMGTVEAPSRLDWGEAPDAGIDLDAVLRRLSLSGQDDFMLSVDVVRDPAMFSGLRVAVQRSDDGDREEHHFVAESACLAYSFVPIPGEL